MSGRSVASALLLVGVALCISRGCVAEIPIFPAITKAAHAAPRTQAAAQVTAASVAPNKLHSSEIKLLTIETIFSTVVSTVSHTVLVYPTCTATPPGVSACRGGDALPAHLTPTHTPTPAPPASQAPGINEEEAEEHLNTSFNMMEVVMPSCDCGEGASTSHRTPRFMGDDDVIILKTTTTLTVDRIVTSAADTTVSLTYNGCVPTDAVSTTPCPDPAQTATVTSSS